MKRRGGSLSISVQDSYFVAKPDLSSLKGGRSLILGKAALVPDPPGNQEFVYIVYREPVPANANARRVD
jgi:hypothetical protein